MILLRYRGDLQKLTGKDRDEIDAMTVADVLKFIRISYGKDAYKRAAAMLIAVNGVSILLLNGKGTKLSDSDTVSFLPVCGGG